MEALEEIYNGENFLATVTMKQADGTALNRVDCVTITAYVYSNTTLLATYIFGTDPEIFAGTAANQVNIEGKSTLALEVGTLIIKVKVTVADAVTYPVEDTKTDIDFFKCFKVVDGLAE